MRSQKLPRCAKIASDGKNIGAIQEIPVAESISSDKFKLKKTLSVNWFSVFTFDFALFIVKWIQW